MIRSTAARHELRDAGAEGRVALDSADPDRSDFLCHMGSFVGGMTAPPLLTRSNPGANELGQPFRGVVVGEFSRGGAEVGSWRPNEV